MLRPMRLTLPPVFTLTLTLAAAPGAADGPAAIYKTQRELLGALAAGTANPDMLTSAVSIEGRHRVNIVRRTRGAGAVAHEGVMELHHIVSGSGTLVTGGTIVRPTGGSGVASIQNGVSRKVGPGDVVLIQAGEAHWYTDLDGPITYLEVRWEEKP
jgi:mannose-6-phosphate isomerase-like protein (cupin superfamily)